MILHLLFQILVSWLVSSSILKLFTKAVSATNDIYQEPALLVALLAFADIKMSLKTGLMAGKILHHTFGLCFTTVYFLIWFYEFGEISWIMALILGFLNGVIHIISWIFLLIVLPSAYLANFKGYYLQLVFLHNIFTITSLTVYRLFS